MTVNAMEVTPSQGYEVLMDAWNAQKDHGIKQSIMIFGEPGVGKTQTIEALAKAIGADLYDVRLTTIETSDLRGLPYYDHSTKTTQWYRPEDLPAENEKPAILFLDELTSAQPHVVPTVYGLLQERRVGKHKLADNVMVIAAGNGTADGAVAYDMGTALANRLTHMIFVQEAEAWINNFAIPKNLHPAVIATIKSRPDLLHNLQVAMKNDDLIPATGRSWERVSDIMYTVKNPLSRKVMIAGRVGTAVAAEFWIVANDIAANASVLQMFKTERSERLKMFPKSLHGLNGLVYGVIGNLNGDNIETSMEILADLGQLDNLMPNQGYAQFPISELCTSGIESVMTKGIKLGLLDKLTNSPTYKEYHQGRVNAGLNQEI